MKKALCIDDKYVGLSITVGEWYDLVDSFTNSYLIIDDRKRVAKIGKRHFKTIEELRDEKIASLGI